ncbi:MAG: SMI1/KNR4 family protein [bacterium]|nr:SMI1/KNR4 family protein [bacterium]
MGIDSFVKVLAPPASPVDTEGNWREIESGMHIQFPDDFKSLITKFGTGGFADFFWIFNPFATGYDYEREIRSIISAYDTAKSNDPREMPFHGNKNGYGLFPFGRSDNGDTFYWNLEDRRPSSIVIYNGRHTMHESFELDTTDFIRGLVSGGLSSKIIPFDLSPAFSPG